MVKPPPSISKFEHLFAQSKKARFKRPIAKKLKVGTPTKISVCPSIFFKSATHKKL